MANNTSENYSFDSTNFLVFLLKWRKPLIIMSTIAALSSAVVSFLIEEKFLSAVTFYPAMASSTSKSLMTEDAVSKNDITAFGEEEQAEQMLQLLESDKIRGRVIDIFNLIDHYEIDPDGDFVITEVNEEFKSNVNFRRTEFNSVKIEVLDKDPEMAAKIANYIFDYLDTLRNETVHLRARQGLEIINREYEEKLAFMQSMNDSLEKIREKGLIEIETQSEVLMSALYRAIAAGQTKGIETLEQEREVLAKYGTQYVSLTENLDYNREHLALLRSKREEVQVDATDHLTHTFVVDRAYPAEKKSYPVRWLIVVISTFSAFLLTILAIIAVENFRKFRSQGVI